MPKQCKVLNKYLLLRIVTAAIAFYGVIAAFNVSLLHFNNVESCPSLGPVPACYVVLWGYAGMVLSTLRPIPSLYAMSWLPVFLLALAGVSAELLSDGPVCPQTATGIPKCYFSFGISSALGILGWLTLRGNKKA